MCGRFTLSYREARVLAAELGVPVESLLDYKPRYNHGVDLPIIDAIVYRNIGLRGGVAPARIYIPELLDDVLYGRINPGRVFDFETDLKDIVKAYDAMDERRAIKSLVRVGTL